MTTAAVVNLKTLTAGGFTSGSASTTPGATTAPAAAAAAAAATIPMRFNNDRLFMFPSFLTMSPQEPGRPHDYPDRDAQTRGADVAGSELRDVAALLTSDSTLMGVDGLLPRYRFAWR
ncbi:MAG: hypothetical protein ACRDGM_18020 [bacterium]